MPYEASLAALVDELRSQAGRIDKSDPHRLPRQLRGQLKLVLRVERTHPGLAEFYSHAIRQLDLAADT